MAKKGLKVFYDDRGKVGNQFLDEAIEEALKPFGYHRWASGFNLIEKTRDLAFEADADG